MERLTEQHYKKSDGHYMKCSEYCEKEDLRCDECKEFDELVDRLGIIEDILGDNYDLDHLRELVEADRDGRCVVLPVKPGSVVRCVNGEPGKQEIVDCITIYAGGRMTYGFHEFGVRETYVDEWSEDEAENYVPVESAEQALRERSEDG